jgi:hypothetical protein
MVLVLAVANLGESPEASIMPAVPFARFGLRSRRIPQLAKAPKERRSFSFRSEAKAAKPLLNFVVLLCYLRQKDLTKKMRETDFGRMKSA